MLCKRNERKAVCTTAAAEPAASEGSEWGCRLESRWPSKGCCTANLLYWSTALLLNVVCC